MSSRPSLDYVMAKLEEIHSDVSDLKVDVSELKEDFIKRQGVRHYLTVAWGVLAMLLGWAVTFILNRH